MNRTLDEHRKANPVATRENVTRLQAFVQEAVRVDALTGDPAWDHFLSYLEAAVKTAERMLANEMAKLRNPHLVNDEAIRICKANITSFETRIATLKEIILLPRFLKQNAQVAKAQIADMAKGAWHVSLDSK